MMLHQQLGNDWSIVEPQDCRHDSEWVLIEEHATVPVPNMSWAEVVKLKSSEVSRRKASKMQWTNIASPERNSGCTATQAQQEESDDEHDQSGRTKLATCKRRNKDIEASKTRRTITMSRKRDNTRAGEASADRIFGRQRDREVQHEMMW